MRSIAKLMKDWQFTGPDGVTAAVVLPLSLIHIFCLCKTKGLAQPGRKNRIRNKIVRPGKDAFFCNFQAAGNNSKVKRSIVFECGAHPVSYTHLDVYKRQVLSGALWEAQLKDIQDAIVFVDEGSTFVSSLDFARAIQKTDNYYCLLYTSSE